MDTTVQELSQSALAWAIGLNIHPFFWYVIGSYAVGFLIVRSWVRKEMPNKKAWDDSNSSPPLELAAFMYFISAPIAVPMVVLWKAWTWPSKT